MRAITTALILAFAVPARAGCIVDEQAADLSAKIASVSKVCPGWKAIEDADVMPLMLATGAVARDEARGDACQMLVSVRVARDLGTLVALPADAQDYACRSLTAMVARNRSVMGLVRDLGLVRE